MTAPMTPVSDLAYQTRVILNDANLEFAEFAAHKIQAESEKISNDKAELVVTNKLGQGYSASSINIGPKLAGPTATIDPETIQKLLADLKNLGDEPELAAVLMAFVEKAIADYKDKGEEPGLTDILKLFVAYASTTLAVKTPEIQQLFSDLMEVKSEDDLVSVLKKYVDSVLEDPTETPPKKAVLAVLLSLLFLIIETQNLREETEAELSGMLVQLSFDQAGIDAQKTVQSSLYGLMGAGAGFGFTFGVTGVAAGMQFKGYWDGRKLIDLQKEGKELGKDTTSLNMKLHQESMQYNEITSDGTLTLRQQVINDRKTFEKTIVDRSTQLKRLENEQLQLQERHRELARAKQEREKAIQKAAQLEENLPKEISALEKEIRNLERNNVGLEEKKLKLLSKEDSVDRHLVENDALIQKQMGEMSREMQEIYRFKPHPELEGAKARINKIETGKTEIENQIKNAKEQIRLKELKKEELEKQLTQAKNNKSKLEQEIHPAEIERKKLEHDAERLDLDIKRVRSHKEEWEGFQTEYKQTNSAVVTSVEKQEAYELELQTKQERIEALQLEIDDLSGSPDFYRNIGFSLSGLNNGSQIFENGFRFMGSKEDAEKIMAQAKKDNFSQMAQSREQERTSGVGGLRSSVQNIVEALYRSDVETKAAVAQAIKG